MNYAEYEYYENTYKGSLSSDLFNSLIVKASREIDKNVNVDITQDVIDELTEKDQDRLQYVACQLCDLSNIVSTSGVSSISIDGVSKKFKTNVELAKDRNEVLDGLPQCLTRYI